MGASGSHNSKITQAVQFPFEELPEELLVHILTYVPAKDIIINLRCVCKSWKAIIDSKSLWIAKCHRDNVALPPVVLYDERFPMDFKKLCVRKPFNRNLLNNWNGAEGLKYWQIIENLGNQFRIEPQQPHGANSLLDITECDVQKCWATSYGWCTKGQYVDLWKNGCSQEMLDKLQPDIEVSDWTASRWDCGTIYQLSVKLLASDKKTVIDKCHIERQEEQWLGKAWNKVEHVFRNYGPGVKYVHFVHRGKDLQFWAGHYGAKMAAPCVKLTFPS